MLISWTFVKIHYYIFGIAGIVANSLLLPLVLFCSKHSIGSYRILIACFVFSSLFTSIENTFLMPMMSVHEHGWILFASGITADPSFGSYFLVMFCISVIIIVLSLMYSYLDRLAFFYDISLFNSLWKCVVSSLIFVMSTALWSFQTLRCLHPTPHLNVVHEENLRYVFGVDVYKTSYIAAEFPFRYRIRNSLLHSFCLLHNHANFCYHLIHRKLMTDISFIKLSQHKVHLQRALFRALIVQTSIPILFTYTPLIISIILGYFRLDIPELCEISSLMLPISQFLDPIIILVFVADYRNAIKSAIVALPMSRWLKRHLSDVDPRYSKKDSLVLY